MKKITILSAFIFAVAAMCLCFGNVSDASAKSGKNCHKCCLNKKKVDLVKGESYALKLKGSKGKSFWTTSDKSVATVSKKGKIKAVGKGTCTVRCKNRKKVYKCKVKVDAKVNTSGSSQIKPSYTPLEKQQPKYYGSGEDIIGCLGNYFIKNEYGNYFRLSDGSSASCPYLINKNDMNGILTFNGMPLSVSELQPGDVLKITFKAPQTCEYPHAIHSIISVEVTDRKPEYTQIRYYYNVSSTDDGNICILLNGNEFVISVKNDVKKITYGTDNSSDKNVAVEAGDIIRIIDDDGYDIDPVFFRSAPFNIEVFRGSTTCK